MAVALKNDPKQARQLVGDFDFAIVEECFQYDECGYYKPFIEAGKAVFEAEYELPTSQFCAAGRSARLLLDPQERRTVRASPGNRATRCRNRPNNLAGAPRTRAAPHTSKEA